ncbi:MAG TPA: hypothetical protein VJL29_05480 [Thermoguttaceae bacterium]|nr:hypothetical protein [Thermoguttaceae bacterium]
MSEYQYVAFRAVDRAVGKKDLAYMRRQSSRAHITPWSFENEYHYGDFHGNAFEMMRRGYDVHVHYANFGTRLLLIRLPNGFPDARAAKPYLAGNLLAFRKDKKGSGGTLIIEPYYEGDALAELWNVDKVLNWLVPLRAEILAGDPRPLYLAHLAVSGDSNHDPEESVEAPVPAGLDDLTKPQRALAKFYGIGKSLVAVAARKSGPAPTATDQGTHYAQWLTDQPQATKDAWLAELLGDAGVSVRAKIRAKFDKAAASRTIAQLEDAAAHVRHEWKQAADKKAARQRAALLKKMAADPKPFLSKTEQLVAQRSTEAYREAAQLLADLREATVGGKYSALAAKQALKLKTANPKLHHLTKALREKGFVPK